MAFSKRTLTLLAALAGCVVSIPACSSTPSSEGTEATGTKGLLDLNLVVNGEAINTVKMTLASAALPASIVRNIDTTHVTGDVKAFAGLLPVGAYTVDFEATTSAGKACTGHGGPFNVTTGSNPAVAVHIVCGGTPTRPARGDQAISADITVNPTSCPYLSQVIVTPTELEAGGTIDLSAVISNPTGTVFAWSASPATGTFASTSSPNTTFTSSAAGGYTLTATLTYPGCTNDTSSTPVAFSAVVGGAGGATGAGSGGASSGGASSGGASSGGASSGGASSGGASSGGASSGGASSGGAPSAGGAPPALSALSCTAAHPQVADTTTCTDCETLNCPDVAPGCNAITDPVQKDLCIRTQSCIRSTNCMDQPPGGIFTCFCGQGVDATTCQLPATQVTGVCATVIKEGFPGASNAAIYQGLIQNNNAVNAATSLSFCDFGFCGSPANFGNNECVPACSGAPGSAP